MKVISGFDEAKAIIAKRSSGLQATEEQERSVRHIIDEVRRRGDRALFEFTERFDRVKLPFLEVSRQKIEQAFRATDAGLIDALEFAADRIRNFHERQRKMLLRDSHARLGWQFRPVARVGVHVPGFVAPLPSSLLMTAIPARVAGVGEIIVVTPPTASGEVAPVTLAAAMIAGVDRVFSVGGAQAVAALAYGTESIPRVDKVCGPGNIYVSLAKKMVFGAVGVDGLYGPSEVVILSLI
ncbi:MAG: histidinol dehydrogenase, partial [Dehalococcoidales bacterium]|nr:histidinol dehydrogenase [Dehalococcoidales bacterium]